MLPGIATILLVLGWVAAGSLKGRRALSSLAEGLWVQRDELAVGTAPLQVATFIAFVGFLVAV